MKTRELPLRRWAILLLVIVPLLAWGLVKPVRLLAPAWVGMICSGTLPVCTEDAATAAEAERLYAEAVSFVDTRISPLRQQPRFIFCSSLACADTFGLGQRSAVTLGTWGTVIGPRAWKDYYVRHELIHHLQGQRIGVLRLLFAPAWFVEGMAYTLSADPRSPLAEPWQSHRTSFQNWYRSVGSTDLWTAFEQL